MAKARDSKPKKSRAKGRTAAEQFATAQRLIEEAREVDAIRLDLTDLPKLATLPPELAGLTAVQSLDLAETAVSDLAPLAGLTALQSLDLRDMQVSDLASSNASFSRGTSFSPPRMNGASVRSSSAWRDTNWLGIRT
jgi:Leucine-rich repeat (LRR) protein